MRAVSRWNRMPAYVSTLLSDGRHTSVVRSRVSKTKLEFRVAVLCSQLRLQQRRQRPFIDSLQRQLDTRGRAGTRSRDRAAAIAVTSSISAHIRRAEWSASDAPCWLWDVSSASWCPKGRFVQRTNDGVAASAGLTGLYVRGTSPLSSWAKV